MAFAHRFAPFPIVDRPLIFCVKCGETRPAAHWASDQREAYQNTPCLYGEAPSMTPIDEAIEQVTVERRLALAAANEEGREADRPFHEGRAAGALSILQWLKYRRNWP